DRGDEFSRRRAAFEHREVCARPAKQRAANLHRVFRGDGLERAAIKEQFDQAALCTIVRARADVLCERFIQLAARASFKRLKELDERGGVGQVTGGARVYEARPCALAALPTLCEI